MHKTKHIEKRWGAFFIFIYFLFNSLACGGGAKVEEYSALQVIRDSSGKETTNNISFKRNKMRMKINLPGKKDSITTIYRKDKNVCWTLFPEKKSYIENRLDVAKLQKAFGKIPEDVKKTVLGTEIVNGFKCKKINIEITTNILDRQVKTTSTIWISNRLDLPIRSEGKNGTFIELSNIKPGHQPKELFIIPEGYTKIKNSALGFEQMFKNIVDQQQKKQAESRFPIKN